MHYQSNKQGITPENRAAFVKAARAALFAYAAVGLALIVAATAASSRVPSEASASRSTAGSATVQR
jgi:hypothetical protein